MDLKTAMADLNITCPHCGAALRMGCGRAVYFRCARGCSYRLTYRQAHGIVAAEKHMQELAKRFGAPADEPETPR